MAASLPSLNYTTPEEFVNYYYEKLKTDLGVYDLQISKVGFIGFFLNLLGYTHFDLKQYYDSLFKEAFVVTSQTEESQYLHASIYGYIPAFANASVATGTIEFDMINWLPRRQPAVVRREVIIGYDNSTGTYIPISSTFKIEDTQFIIDAIYKFVEIVENGSYLYYVDIITNDGSKITLPSSSSTISVPLYSTSQYIKKEVFFELKPYNFGSYQTYYFDIDSGFYLSDLEVYVTEVGSTSEEKFDVKYTKYLEKGNDTVVFLRKITSTIYVIEFGSGIRGKWVSGASIRLIIKSTRGASGNLIDKTNLKIQVSGTVLAFDYVCSPSGQLTPVSPSPNVSHPPLVDFDYSEGGLDPLSGEDLRDEIINYIQTRNNMISRQDFYNIVGSYVNDFRFLFKKFNIYDNIFHLCRSFRDRNQTILYTTNHSEQVMNLIATSLPSFTISASASVGTGSLVSGDYGYFVVAVDEWGQTVPSSVVSVSITSPENSVIITWDSVDYATKYRVYGRYVAYHDQYWEVDASYPQPPTYSYTDDGTDGTPDIEPISYELADLYYRPTFTINGRSFISPYIYKGNTRMNYYDGYLMKDLSRVEFAEIVPDISTLGTGFDTPIVYLNLEYDESSRVTIVRLRSYETISNLVFTISVFGNNLNIINRRMECFPLSNNYFEYTYTNPDTFGIFEDEIQIEVKGGISNSVITHEYEDYVINSGSNDTLVIKFNDSSEGYTDPFTTVTFTAGTQTAATLASEINVAVGAIVASVYEDDDGNNRIKITPPTGTVSNVFIASTGSTCLTTLGLTGDDTSPAVLNGTMTTLKFTCRTNKFYQLVDVSDQLRLMRYTTGSDSYVINIPVIDSATFASDPDYYLDKIKNFMTSANFSENRMITDNVQCRFLNSYLIESPFIESVFLQSGNIFSNVDYNWLNPVIETRDDPPPITLDSTTYRVGTSPASGSDFDGHANEIATYHSGPPASWEFYSPEIDDFVLDSSTNIYWRWSGSAWVSIPSILLPMKIEVEIKADKNYVQRNNIDIPTEKDNLLLALAEYLQKNFTGTDVVFYNSLIIEFIHTGRDYVKSVRVYVTDSSSPPNEMNNGIEVRSDNDILKGLKDKLDIVKYVPPIIYWDIDNIVITVYIE